MPATVTDFIFLFHTTLCYNLKLAIFYMYVCELYEVNLMRICFVIVGVVIVLWIIYSVCISYILYV